MKKIYKVFQKIFGIPWIIFGIQHFMFADFVAGLVPAYFPFRLFWAYFTGAAMIAAGLSFITDIKLRLAAFLLGAMLLMFILLIHVSTLTNDPSAIHWTRALQDFALASIAFMLTGNLSKQKAENNFLENIVQPSRYVFAVLLIIFGASQFLDPDFLTAKVPAYFPFRLFWVYLTGTAMILTGASVIINKKARLTAISLGVFLLLLNLLYHGYLLANDLHNPLAWTAAMLDLAITCGVFILAAASPDEANLNDFTVGEENSGGKIY